MYIFCKSIDKGIEPLEINELRQLILRNDVYCVSIIFKIVKFHKKKQKDGHVDQRP